MPLARIWELLGAEPVKFGEAVTQIDEALKKKIRVLTQQRLEELRDDPGASS
jgi:hypothetical protein